MALTPQEAVAIWTARGFAVHHGARAGGWLVRMRDGNRVQIPPQPGPVEAIEAADAHLKQREGEADRRDTVRLVQEMQRGRYFHRSRLVEEDDGAGGTAQVVVFDIIRSNGTGAGSPTTITDRRSVVIAWRDLVDALAAGSPP